MTYYFYFLDGHGHRWAVPASCMARAAALLRMLGVEPTRCVDRLRVSDTPPAWERDDD